MIGELERILLVAIVFLDQYFAIRFRAWSERPHPVEGI